MSGFLVNILIDVSPQGITDEATCEAKDLDEALARMKEAAETLPHFRAITLVHIEDAPNLMQGSVQRNDS